MQSATWGSDHVRERDVRRAAPRHVASGAAGVDPLERLLNGDTLRKYMRQTRRRWVADDFQFDGSANRLARWSMAGSVSLVTG